jgi:hypothetical protein
LYSKTGADGGAIWISIMGEVYDVSSGPEYYAPGAGYSAFAGKEGSVPFVTGIFTDEEMNKSLKHLTNMQLKQLNDWRGFYKKEEKYPFVGLLQGRYYDENGKPTKSLKKARKRMKLGAEELDKLMKQGREANPTDPPVQDQVDAQKVIDEAEAAQEEEEEAAAAAPAETE